MNQRKAGVVLSYISLGLGNVISIIYTPIMLNLLGKNEYGLYSLASSIVGYLGLLNFGFTGSYIRFYSRYKVKNDDVGIARLNGMFLAIFSGIAFITLLAGIVLVFNSDAILGSKLTAEELAKGKILLSILVLNMCLSLPATVFYVYIAAHERFVFQKIVNIIQIIVGPLTILPILFLGYGSVGLITVTTILTVIINLTNLIFCFKKLKIKFTFSNLDFSLFKEMSLFSSFIFLNVIIDQINWNVDNYILGRVKGTATVAVYSVGASLNKYYLAFAVIISSVFIPQVNRMVAGKNDNTELSALMIKMGRIQFIILSFIASGFAIFGRQFINLWVGKEYDDAYFIGLILILAASIPLVQSIGIEIQQAKNKHRFRSYAYFIIAILNIVLSIPLAKMYDGIGSAIGTGCALILGNGLIMNWYYHKKIGLNMKDFWREIMRFFPALILPGIFGTLVFQYFSILNIFSLIILIIIYGICFMLSMWFLGLNKYEKNIFMSYFNKRRIKLK